MKSAYVDQALLACVEVGKRLTATRNLKDILKLVMTKTSELIAAQDWSLLLKDEDTGELNFEIVAGAKEECLRGIRLAPGEGIAGHVVQSGEPLFLEKVNQDERFCTWVDDRSGFKTESIICVPLQIHGKVMGVIEIVNVKDMATFKKMQLPVLNILSDFAAIAIANSRYCAKIQKMSITDEYTGLYNARYLHEALENQVRQAGNLDSVFAVVFVDIDDFKEVVDENGHLMASQVLKEVGQCIAGCLTAQDVLIKYGGDEYILILPDKNRQQSVKLVNQILDTLRSTTFLKQAKAPVRLTASFGIAMFPEDGQTKRDLLMLADKTMYSVKQSTKNGIGMTERTGSAITS